MATKKPDLPSEVKKLTDPTQGTKRIADLNKQIDLLEELKNLGDEESKAYKSKMESIELYQRTLFDDTQRHLEQLNEHKTLMEEIEAFKKIARETDAKAAAVTGQDAEEKRKALKKEAEDHRLRVKNLEELLKIQRDHRLSSTAAFKEYIKEAKEAEAASDKWLTSRKKHIQVERQLEEAVKAKQTEKSKGKTIFQITKEAVVGSIDSLGDFGEALKDLSIETAAISMFIPGTGIDAYHKKVMGMGAEMDNAYREMVKAGVSHTPELLGIMNSIIDPIGHIGKEFGTSQDAAERMLTGIGIFGPEAKEALASVKNNVMLFRKSWIAASETNRHAAEETTNLIAGLKMLGVATDDSANIVNYFTKGLGKTPAMANDSLKSMENMAHSLDINVGKAFKDFIATQDTLAQYGSRNEEVFYNLEAQVVATGIEVGTLAKVADKLDTFKGAAQAAQGFNAVLGKTVLSVTDLVHAEPAEKIEMLKDAFDRSGMTFETSNRRMKSIVANMLGMSVVDASKLFGSKEDYFDIQSGMNTTATEVEELEERIKSSKTVSEAMQLSMSNLGEAQSRLVARARQEAEKANTFLLEMFATLRDETGDSLSSLAAHMAQLGVAAKIASGAKEAAGYATLSVGGLMAIDKLVPIPKFALYAVEKKFGKDFGGKDGVGELDDWIGKADDRAGGSYMVGEPDPNEARAVVPAAPGARPVVQPQPRQLAAAGGTTPPIVVNVVTQSGELQETVEFESQDLAGFRPGQPLPTFSLRLKKPVFSIPTTTPGLI